MRVRECVCLFVCTHACVRVGASVCMREVVVVDMTAMMMRMMTVMMNAPLAVSYLVLYRVFNFLPSLNNFFL